MPARRLLVGTAVLCSVTLLAFAYGCHDNARLTDPTLQADIRITATGLIKLAYSCGNYFRVRNLNPTAVSAAYTVSGSPTQWPLELPAPAVGKPYSETFFLTPIKGTVSLFYQDTLVTSVPNASKGCATTFTKGSWSPVSPWPLVAIHATLLPDGNVLAFQRDSAMLDPMLWNPTTGFFTTVPSGVNLFCSGHAFLPDGRLLVAGGHASADHGIRNAMLFDYVTQTWTPAPPMLAGRWYPTNTTLADGEVLTIAGGDENAATNLIPEVYDQSGNWRELTDASKGLAYYPRMFLAPDGRVFHAGPEQNTSFLDPSGTGSWTPGPVSSFPSRAYGSAVMYEPGKILIVGGGAPQPTATAEVIDLNGSATWRSVASMPTARRQHTATMLPDGMVLVTGGTKGKGFNNAVGAQKPALIWNPATERWTVMASASVNRLYHSTALLLPDGRVLSAGGGQAPAIGEVDQYNGQLFSPSYLFNPTGGPSERPIISSAPTSTAYGATFQVDSPNASEVVSVTLVRLGSVTHAFDQNQRFMRLAFTRDTGFITVTAPTLPTDAPPGHYMLFLVNMNGVPSVASILQVL
ncbi:MAG: galactose oxidase-like domain-containing protein [Gemmatimonadota bacterium]